jgi:hypothetical protein
MPPLERETGFEPATSTLARSHSTAELFPLYPVYVLKIGALVKGKIDFPHRRLIFNVSTRGNPAPYEARTVAAPGHVLSNSSQDPMAKFQEDKFCAGKVESWT